MQCKCFSETSFNNIDIKYFLAKSQTVCVSLQAIKNLTAGPLSQN